MHRRSSSSPPRAWPARAQRVSVYRDVCSVRLLALRSVLSRGPRWPRMGGDQAFRRCPRKQYLECGNHLLLYYALRRRYHSFIGFDFNYEFIVHLQHELRLTGQRRAEPGIDADQCLDGNFRRGTLNGQVKGEIPGVLTPWLPGEAIDSAALGRDGPCPPRPRFLLTLPASHTWIGIQEAVNHRAGLFHRDL